MRRLRLEFVLHWLAGCVIVAIHAFASTAMAQTVRSNMSIQAAPTDTELQLRVTWVDFLDEDGYQLVANTDSTPPPVFTSSGQLGNGWELIANLSENTTEFTHNTIFSQTYSICGLKGLNISCFGPSNYATPKYPPEPATVSSLQVSLRATDRLRIQWTQSSNTMYSRAEVKRGSNVLSSEENDTDQSVTFSELLPNETHTITVCVRNQEQTAADETCRSTEAVTLPLIPLAPVSVGVDQSDPKPRQRSINFSYDNKQSNAVAGIAVRLIKDDQVLQVHYVYPNSFGTREYEHTFSNLLPFTDYEVWVIPYNQTGVGTSAGIGFTTPTEISLSVIPLSGDSVMLRWLAPVIGEYTIFSFRTGELGVGIYTFRVLRPSEVRVVLEGIDDPLNVKVSWRFAYLRAWSAAKVATPLTLGAPEIVSVRGQAAVFFDSFTRKLSFGTRYTVTFRTTTAGAAEYILQRRTATGWETVATVGSISGVSTTFADNTLYTLQHESTKSSREHYRVCKRQPLNLGNRVLCGESDDWSSEGSNRVRVRN